MTATHDELALAGPYVLGALDRAERRAFEAHLAGCELCRVEVRSLQPVAEALAYAAPQQTPAAGVRERVLQSVLGRVPPQLAPARSTGAAQWLPLAAAILIAIGLGAYAWRLQGRVSLLEGRVVEAERRAAAAERDTLQARRVADEAQLTMAVLAAPDLTRIDLAGQARSPQARGRALWSRNRGMVFTSTDLPAAPSDRVYQVWVVTAKGPVSAGLLAPDASGRTTQMFPTPIDIPPPVAVTLEPAGGVPSPTGEMYLVGKPAL